MKTRLLILTGLLLGAIAQMSFDVPDGVKPWLNNGATEIIYNSIEAGTKKLDNISWKEHCKPSAVPEEKKIKEDSQFGTPEAADIKGTDHWNCGSNDRCN